MREAHVTFDESAYETMGLGELVSLTSEAGVRDFEELACHGDGAIVRVTVDDRVDEAKLDSLDAVDQWEHVPQPGGQHLYVIEFTAPNLPESLGETAEDLVGTCDPKMTDCCVDLSLVGSQETIADAVRKYQDAGVAPDLRKLGTYAGGDEPLDGLTDRQEEVVRTAYEMGYYDVPRTVSTEDVAAELDLDPSTVTEHLQRAERNLLAQHL